MDDREHNLYFDRQILPVPGGPTNIPLVDDERGLGRGANSEGIIKGTGTPLEVESVGLPPSIRRRFQLVDLACYSGSCCFLVCIEFFQADCCEVFN